MPRNAATEEERDAQRRRLRRAAADLHREGGVRAVTVRAVAARAGVSTGLLYSYFADRSDLLRSLWMVPITKLGRSLTDVEQLVADPVERIERLLQTYIDFTVADAETHRGLLLFVRPPDSTTDVNEDPDQLVLFAALRRAVEAGQSLGTIREGDPRAMAQLLWSGVHGALALPINIDTYDFADGATIATDMVDALIRSIALTTPTTASLSTSSPTTSSTTTSSPTTSSTTSSPATSSPTTASPARPIAARPATSTDTDAATSTNTDTNTNTEIEDVP